MKAIFPFLHRSRPSFRFSRGGGTNGPTAGERVRRVGLPLCLLLAGSFLLPAQISAGEPDNIFHQENQADHPPFPPSPPGKGPFSLFEKAHTKGAVHYSVAFVLNRPQIRADFLLEAPLEKAWAVITDFEKYKDFLSGYTESTILRQKGNKIAVRYRYSRLKFVKFDLTVIYALDEVNHTVQWFLREGAFYDFTGSWKLEREGDRTRAIYTSYNRPRMVAIDLLPEEIWVNMLKSSDVPQYVKAFRKRIEE